MERMKYMEPIKITSLKINNFRLFNNVSFELGTHITVFSGTNSVGKSTLLGLLGNSSELKTKIGKPIIQPQFRTEFSEIFKMSREHDPSASNILTIYFNDSDYRTGRITWTKDSNGKIRPRVLSYYKDKNGKSHTQKKAWPTLFLGLSRLYPIGEAPPDDLKSKSITDNDEKKKNLRENAYKKILSLNDDITDTKAISFIPNKRLKSIGFSTDKYDYLVNSSGQYNIGQILLAVESFARLKETLGTNYQGGLLLIDEFDASLHPSAQNRLFDYLYKQSKSLDIQIVFTTHSLSLLEHISKKTEHNYNDRINNIEIHYLSVANQSLKCKRSPKLSTLRSLLLEEPSIRNRKQIKILTEDNEARWFIKNIFQYDSINDQFQLLDVQIGKNSIISLAKGDTPYFANTIIILDGDAKSDTDLQKEIKKLPQTISVMYLPGNQSPESELLKFLQNKSEHSTQYFDQDICFENGLTLSLFSNLDLSKYTSGPKREQLKMWFNQYLSLFESSNVFYYWSEENNMEITAFKDEFKEKLNTLRKRLSYF